jgi:serine/threonine-protein kinase
VESGKVISQSPVSGSLGKKGDTVTITVSQGKEPAIVPKVVGMTEENALTTLANAGLTGSVNETKYSDDVEKGYVIEQSETQNSQLAAGSTVYLTVSLGPEPVEDVTTATYSASLRVKKPSGDISNVSGANIYLYDGPDGSGNVIGQWANQSIDSFGEDGLVISKGGILSSSGSVMIQWLDLDGNVIGVPQVQDITFNKE